MNNFRIDPRKQFSKRLARWTAIFWFFYMTWLSSIMIISPAASLYCVYMGLIVTVVMVLNVWAYTKNSIYEKGVFAMLDKTKLELTLKNAPSSSEQDESTDDSSGEGENNG